MILHFAFDMEQYDRLTADRPADRLTVATADPGIRLRAEGDGHRTVDLGSFLDTADIRDAYDLVRALDRPGWAPALDGLRQRGIALAEAARRDLWFPVFGMELARRATERAIARLSPQGVVLCEPRGQAVFWDTIPTPPGCLPAAVARTVAEQCGLDVRIVRTDATIPLPTPAPPVPGLLERVERLLDNARGRKPLCLFLDELEYRRQGAALEAEARKNGRFTFLLKASGDYAAIGDADAEVVWYDLLSRFPGEPGLRRSLDEAWRAFRAGPSAAFPLFDSPHVRFQLDAFRERIFLCGRVAEAASWLMEHLAPTLCVQGLDAYGPGRVWGRAARASGARTVTFLHGDLSPHVHKYDRLRSEADLLVVRSDHDRAAMLDLGRTPDGLIVQRPAPTAERRADAGKGEEILLLTALTGYGLYNPMVPSARLRRDWEALTAMMARHPDLRFRIKPHPRYDHFDLYERLPLPENVRFDRDIPLEEALAKARAAVMVDYPSSVVLACLRAGIPLIYLPGTWPVPELRTALESALVRKPATVEALEALLPELLRNGPERDRAIADGFAFLHEFYGEDGPKDSPLWGRISAEYGSHPRQPERTA